MRRSEIAIEARQASECVQRGVGRVSDYRFVADWTTVRCPVLWLVHADRV